MNYTPMHTLALVITINEAVFLFAGRIAKYTAYATEKEQDDQSPHATSYTRALASNLSWSLVAT
jgi:hypothetical protein